MGTEKERGEAFGNNRNEIVEADHRAKKLD